MAIIIQKHTLVSLKNFMRLAIIISVLGALLLPQHSLAQTVCVGPTGATCVGCATTGASQTEFTSAKSKITPKFQKAYEKIKKSLDKELVTPVVNAILAKSSVETKAALQKLVNSKTVANTLTDAAITQQSNIIKLNKSEASKPTSNGCEAVANNKALDQSGVVRQALVATWNQETQVTTNPSAFTPAERERYDIMNPGTVPPQFADTYKDIAAAKIKTSQNGQCIAGGVVFASIASKYGLGVNDITEVDDHNAHVGGAFDISFTKNQNSKDFAQGAKDLKNGVNSPEAARARQIIQEMASVGANEILLEDFYSDGKPDAQGYLGNKYRWNGTTFVNDGKLDHGRGDHLHVGNKNFNTQVDNADKNLNLPYDCAKIEQLTGKTIDELQQLMAKDAVNAQRGPPCKPNALRACKLKDGKFLGACYFQPNAYKSDCCKCHRIDNYATMTTGGRWAKFIGITNHLTTNMSVNSSSVLSNEPGQTNNSLMNGYLQLNSFTGGTTTKTNDQVQYVRTLLAAEIVNPDEKLNTQAVAETVAGRNALLSLVKRSMIANLQGAVLNELAAYQMPTSQGGNDVLGQMVKNILGPDPTDAQKKNFTLLANTLLGANGSISQSALSQAEVWRLNSAAYQESAALDTATLPLQFVVIQIAQIREKYRQLRILQMINLMNAIGIKGSGGAGGGY